MHLVSNIETVKLCRGCFIDTSENRARQKPASEGERKFQRPYFRDALALFATSQVLRAAAKWSFPGSTSRHIPLPHRLRPSQKDAVTRSARKKINKKKQRGQIGRIYFFSCSVSLQKWETTSSWRTRWSTRTRSCKSLRSMARCVLLLTRPTARGALQTASHLALSHFTTNEFANFFPT